MPTHAPTGSTSLSRDTTAIFERPPRFASRGLDPDDSLVHLRHFLLEELREHLDAGAGKNDLRALGGLVDVDDVGPQPIVGAVGLPRNLLGDRQHRLGAAQIHDDRAFLETPNDPVQDFALAILVLLVDLVALGLANALDDHLLRGLG